MIKDRPLHHQIWEREIEKLETFAECVVQFIGREDEFWRLFDKADLWKKIFECRVPRRFSPLCDHQIRYLSTLSKCLDIKLIRDFFRQIQVLDTFLAPILGFLVETSFHEPYEHWGNSSKLAFAIIYKIHTLDFELRLEENLKELNLKILEDDVMSDIWRPNRVHNEQKLSETLQIYWQLFCAPSEGLTGFQVKRSIVDCDDCLPLHDLGYVTQIRNGNMALVWTLPADTYNEELLLTRMRPFIVNVCLPPAEEPLDLGFIALQVRVCPHNMSRKLFQDREIIRAWVRLVLTYRPDETSSWSSAVQLIQAILGLYQSERQSDLPLMGPSSLERIWSPIEERIAWFGEFYCELVREEPRSALNVLIRGPRFLNIQCVVMFSAILLYNGTLTENDQLDIINLAVNQYNEIIQTRPALVEEYRFGLALLQLCLHREACLRIMITKTKDLMSHSMRFWLKPNFFADHIVGHSAFRFLNYDTPRNLFQAAMYTIEVALLFKSKYRRRIKSKFESRLKEVVEVGGQNGPLAAIELTEVERMKRVMMRRKRRRLMRQKNQKNILWLMPPMTTMAT